MSISLGKFRNSSFLRHSTFVISNARLQTRPKQAIIPRDVGILVRFSEPPFSTTIQVFQYHGAEFCALAASLVECAGSPFKSSPIPARRGGVSNGVAECLV
jgi:hypothetical protein